MRWLEAYVRRVIQPMRCSRSSNSEFPAPGHRTSHAAPTLSTPRIGRLARGALHESASCSIDAFGGSECPAQGPTPYALRPRCRPGSLPTWLRVGPGASPRRRSARLAATASKTSSSPGAPPPDIDRVEALDQRTLDRFTSELLDGPSSGESSSPGRRSIATYAPVRQLLAWCQREGEGVRAKPQLPRRHHGKGRRSAEGPLRPRQSSPSRPAHVRQLVDARR